MLSLKCIGEFATVSKNLANPALREFQIAVSAYKLSIKILLSIYEDTENIIANRNKSSPSVLYRSDATCACTQYCKSLNFRVLFYIAVFSGDIFAALKFCV